MTSISGPLKDNLHPTPEDATARYVDPGQWKVDILFRKELSNPVFRKTLEGWKHHCEKKTFPSFDALCEFEVRRRLQGKTPTAYELKKYKRQVAFSACNREDLICQPQVLNPDLRKKLQISSDDTLKTTHLFAKNSSLNGLSFQDDEGKTVVLDCAITSSSDRKSPTVGNMRRIFNPQGTTIAYTGRVDSHEKAEEQAKFLFFQEMGSKRKGITEVKQPDGSVRYELDYVVDSVLSTPWWFGKKIPKVIAYPERKYTEDELQALQQLQEKGWMEIQDPSSGKTYTVRFRPMLFSGDLNVFLRLEQFLPPSFTGESRAREISRQGFAQLKRLSMQRLEHWKQNNLFPEKTKILESSLSLLECHMQSACLQPEEEVLHRDLVCKMLDIPIVYHCKSSTDRTSILVAISSTLQQWIDLKLPLSDTILQDELWKELFMANWTAGHQITRYARDTKGTVNGETFHNQKLGLSISRGFTQNPIVSKLVPDRYLTEYPLKKKILCVFSLTLTNLVIQITTLACAILGTLGFCLSLGTHPQLLSPLRDVLYGITFTSFGKLFKAIPAKVLNEQSPSLKGKQWIS